MTGDAPAFERLDEPDVTVADLDLPARELASLREAIGRTSERRPLLRWLDRFLGRRRRIAMFVGPPGTGKTLAVRVLGKELGVDVYRVDLRAVVSKYAGETEKNLAPLFDRAESGAAILFFDEADALFGKRSEVRDSHDRYANIEISYLLQKMEEYQGITVLATNFRKNLDDAFVRRLHFAIDFPFPDEERRLEIWQRVFPTEAPRASDVDLAFLARQFKLAGGNIKNIAVASAFLAAQEAQPIRMEHVVQAVKREYQKMGKLLTVLKALGQTVGGAVQKLAGGVQAVGGQVTGTAQTAGEQVAGGVQGLGEQATSPARSDD
jgi:SpoVK/Ycf46/Vps4 family AAA+-type ATPase